MNCPKCNSSEYFKDGKKTALNHRSQQFRCKKCNHVWSEKIAVPLIQGITADERVDFENDIMPYLIKIGERAKQKNVDEVNQVITMPNRPFAIVLLSDIHAGGKTDYQAIQDDIAIIKSTPDMYVGNTGDNIDNFIIGKLQSIQKEQPTTFDMEQRFLKWLFQKLSGHLLFWCSGNHDNWTKRLVGFDFIREGLKGTHCLFDTAQIFFTLKWGNNEQKILVRHKWRNGSIFNSTHGIEVGWERVGLNFDVGIGGHTHIATLCRPFIRENKKRFAVLLGTYKVRDQYARDCGFASSYGTGSGAFVYNPDGRVFWCEDLKTARELLLTWQNEANLY